MGMHSLAYIICNKAQEITKTIALGFGGDLLNGDFSDEDGESISRSRPRASQSHHHYQMHDDDNGMGQYHPSLGPSSPVPQYVPANYPHMMLAIQIKKRATRAFASNNTTPFARMYQLSKTSHTKNAINNILRRRDLAPAQKVAAIADVLKAADEGMGTQDSVTVSESSEEMDADPEHFQFAPYYEGLSLQATA